MVDQEDAEVTQMCEAVLLVPKAEPALQPVLNTIAMQLLSYYCALERACEIDRPRNLAKSVTVL